MYRELIMKTIRQTSVGSWVGGVLFVGIGLLTLMFTKVTTLSCTRVIPATCQLVASGLLGSSKLAEIPLNMLQGAKVERTEHKDDKQKKSYIYRVIILTSSGEIPFASSADSNKYGKRATASHINNFVKNSRTLSLVEKNDDRLVGYSCSGILIAIGVYILIYGRNKKIIVY